MGSGSCCAEASGEAVGGQERVERLPRGSARRIVVGKSQLASVGRWAVGRASSSSLEEKLRCTEWLRMAEWVALARAEIPQQLLAGISRLFLSLHMRCAPAASTLEWRELHLCFTRRGQ